MLSYKGFLELRNPQKFRFIKNKQSKFKENCVYYRSLLEAKFFRLFDLSPKVKEWGTECIEILYFDQNKKKRTYYPDVFLILVSESKLTKYIIEIKPQKLVYEPLNQIKFHFAQKFCEKNNLKFLVFTERLKF